MTWAEALQSILGSLAVILALIVQSLLARRFGVETAAKMEEKVDAVHQVVNGNHAAALARIDQLGSALSDAGIPVPPHDAPAAGEAGTGAE